MTGTYVAQYNDFDLYAIKIEDSTIGYVFDKTKNQWHECIIKIERDLSGFFDTEYKGEFITDDVYYVGFYIVQTLNEKPDIYIAHHC